MLAQTKKPPTLGINRQIVAFSYFYDRTVPLGLKSPISPREIERVGKQLCSAAVMTPEISGQWCLDLAYLHGLLTETYGIESEQKIEVVKQIDGWEAGWALGSALEQLEKY